MTLNFVIPEFNIGGAGTPPLEFYRRGFNLGGSGSQPSWKDIILSGNTALTLVNSKANGLNYLKLFGGTEQRNLPNGYTEYEYLRSSGTQYIDLGYKGKGNTKVEIKFRYYQTSSATGSGRVFGSRQTSSSNAFAIGTSSGIVSSTGNKVFWCYDGQSFYVVEDVPFGLDEWQTVVFSATEHTVNGTTEGDDYTITTFETPQNLKLFAFDNNGTIGCGYVDIAYCKLWDDDGTLVRDVVPAGYGTSYSMYDRVSGSMLPNAGTGTFEVGNTAVPTPDMPIDIVCNNGAIKMVDNELPEGYKRVLGYECDNNVLWQITGFKLRGSDTVRISFSVNAACNVFGCYQGADAKDNYDLHASSSSGGKYLRYADGTYLSYWSPSDMGQRFNVVFSPTGTSGMPQDSTWKEKSFTSENDLLIGSTTLTSTSAKLKGNLYGNVIVEGRLKIIPCERVSDGVLGYYDMYSKTFFEPTGTPTSLGYDGSHYVLTIDGTTEKVKVDTTGGTATAETLLKVGNYQDVQSVLDGVVTRNVGIKIFDGTETLSFNTAGSTWTLFTSPFVCDGTNPAICTHGTGSKTYSSVTTLNICAGSGNRLFIAMDWATFGVNAETPNNEKRDTLLRFFADQYNAGTPVVVLYPLSESTTESVTAQPLTIQAGTNVVEITQASIDNLELEVSYKAGVEVTVTEIENAQLDNSVEVTVNG